MCRSRSLVIIAALILLCFTASSWWLQMRDDSGLGARVHGSNAPTINSAKGESPNQRESINGIEGHAGVAIGAVLSEDQSYDIKSISESAALNFEASANAHRKEAVRLGAVTDAQFPMRELANEAHSLFFAELMQSASLMARKGYHEIVPMGSPRPVTRNGFRQVWCGAYTHPTLGQVEVVVMVPLGDPRISAAHKNYQELSAAADQEYVGVFNNQPWDARRDRWLGHLQAIQELSDVSQSKNLTDIQRARRRSELEPQIIDLSRYLMEEPGYWLRIKR